MTARAPGEPNLDANARQGYFMGYSPAVVNLYARRNVLNDAGFLTPYLKTGMDLLDCGCGPGTITIGLAEAVSPGQVVGVDIDPKQVQLAQLNASQKGFENVRFQVADAREIPFPDASFDVVFANAVLAYYPAPEHLLDEMRRVLRPGGLIGVREPDFGGVLISPACEGLQYSHNLYEKVAQHNGGDWRRGRTVRSLLHRTHFQRCEGSANCEFYGTPEAIQAIAETEARRIETAAPYRQAVELGFTDPRTLEQAAGEIRDWGRCPDAFLARTWCAAIGWKQA
jgi:ubiquinone/menaquinone biosynthesis C-methylase UbiE